MNFIKKVTFAMILGFLSICCKNSVKKNVQTAEVDVQNTETVAIAGKTKTTIFTIEGMSCAVMCAAKIEKELARQEGVQNAKVDFDTKTATIKYDDAKQTPEKLTQIVEAVAGGTLYRVSNVKIN